ncbi:MAG: hypothetical protein AAFR61_26165, partial [Bacteroidota bacterium]
MEHSQPAKRNVDKACIIAYGDKDFRNSIGKPFFIPINPETYSESYKVEYNQEGGHGNQGTDSRLKRTAPEELKLDFTFDGTNTVEGYALPDMSVQDQIAAYKKVVYDFNGDLHRPNFLKVFWGELKFPCILTNMSINYTLFDRQGKPLRAKLSSTFLHYIAPDERVAREGKRSPDLSRDRILEEGQRL